MLWFLALILLLTLTGHLVHCLMEGGRSAVRPEKAAAALNMGTALCGTALTVGLAVFDRFAFPLLYILPALLLVACMGRRQWTTAVSKGLDEAPAMDQPRKSRGAVLAFPTFAILFTLFLTAVTHKDGASGDYLTIWGFKALVLSKNDAIRIPSFMDWRYIHHHQDYPVLFPCIQALLYRLSGDVLDRAAKLLYPLLLLCASLALYFRLLRRRGLTAALIGGGLCLLTPAISGFHPGICSAYMDVPLGLFLLLAFLSGMEWLDRGRATDGLIAGLYLAAAALTKNEGMAAAALALTIFCIAWLRQGAKKYWKGFLWLALLPAASAGAWFVLRTHLPAGASDYVDLFTDESNLERISAVPSVMARYLLELVHFERWGFLWVLFALGAPLWIRRGWWIPGAFVAAMALVHISAVTVSPLNVDYQILSAVSRLVGQLAPIAAACVGAAFGRENTLCPDNDDNILCQRAEQD